MNPQDQPNTPSNNNSFGPTPNGNEQSSSFPTTPVTEQSTPEADAAALQAIDALESEELGDAQETPSANPVTVIPTAEPIVAPSSLDIPTASSNQPVTPSVSPIETSATGVAAAMGASLTDAQAPVSAPTEPITTKKKSSKLLIILIVGVLVLVAALAGYFVWQSMQ